MIAFFARLTTFDWVKVCAYVIAALTFLGGQSVLTTWGMSAADAATWSQRIATVIGALTLLSNAIKNPSPPAGTHPVLTTAAVPTPETLTTAIAPKGK